MERGSYTMSGYSQQSYSPRRAMVSEAPSGGEFYGKRVLVSGGGGIVGSALIARILREGGAVIAVRATAAFACKGRPRARRDKAVSFCGPRMRGLGLPALRSRRAPR